MPGLWFWFWDSGYSYTSRREQASLSHLGMIRLDEHDLTKPEHDLTKPDLLAPASIVKWLNKWMDSGYWQINHFLCSVEGKGSKRTYFWIVYRLLLMRCYNFLKKCLCLHDIGTTLANWTRYWPALDQFQWSRALEPIQTRVILPAPEK